MKDSSSLCITMSDEGVICPLIDLLVDLFLYLLTFSYVICQGGRDPKEEKKYAL